MTFIVWAVLAYLALVSLSAAVSLWRDGDHPEVTETEEGNR